MRIKEMFKKSIDRQINGVIQVEQDKEDVIEKEVEEYVVTVELKKHLDEFFAKYSRSFDEPTDNTGVWITGFFGSGKSHFLKMLSYLLENKVVNGKPMVEFFREKYNDELSFLPIETCTNVPTETILFNIDVEGFSNKDETVVLRVFAKMFYEHLGFYGSDLKVVKLEQFITKRGKMDEFKRVYKEIAGKDWEDERSDYFFFIDQISQVMSQVLGMSEKSAYDWLDDNRDVEISIKDLAKDVTEYVKSKGDKFRLIFLVDEVGQYVGTNTDLLMNLQSIVEQFGSTSGGRVWVLCTGQEALESLELKVRQEEFSRIMGRFPIRLSLTSSSVGEVIEKRILEKKDHAYKNLCEVYENNDSVLDNLYSLQSLKKDLHGYRSADEFARIFPFVPYQFVILKDVFTEIRKKGHSGQHQSSGERSMLNSFHEAAQDIKERDEFALVPMYAFYNTLHSFLDTSIRSVLERAERAALNHDGLDEFDVNLLKLLYLICYIDDIPSNVENLTILMADDLRVDKQDLREKVKVGLERLINQNYVSRNGDVYMFLTDEEQDIARDIKNTDVDLAAVTKRLGSALFDDIYKQRKYRYNNKRDFDYNKRIDYQVVGSNVNDDLELRFFTSAMDASELQEIKLTNESVNRLYIVLSEDARYFENMEMSEKIKKYAKQIIVNQKPESVQKIITDKQNEAKRLENAVIEDLKKAIVEGTFYVNGRKMEFAGTDAVQKINKAFEYLVDSVYYKLSYINENYDEAMIGSILRRQKPEMEISNEEAREEVKSYLTTMKDAKMSISMNDLMTRYSKKPFGWAEIDIAGIVSRLIENQEAVAKYNGEQVEMTDYRLVGYLTKKSEINKLQISIKEKVDSVTVNKARGILRDYFTKMSIPTDEDQLILFIKTQFNEKRMHLQEYMSKNKDRKYPGFNIIKESIDYIDEILINKNDDFALLKAVVKNGDDLLAIDEEMEDVENFFKNQYKIFENADHLQRSIQKNSDYYLGNEIIQKAVEEIRNIVSYKDDYNFSRISNLNTLIQTIKDQKDILVNQQRQLLNDLIDQCLIEVETKAKEDQTKLEGLLNQARNTFNGFKEEISTIDELPTLENKKNRIIDQKDRFVTQMTRALIPVKVDPQPSKQPERNKNTKMVDRRVIFSTKTIKTEADIDQYLQEVKRKLMGVLKDTDEINIR